MSGETFTLPLPVPKPRPFPKIGAVPGPRCGHTLTAVAGSENESSRARLILFGGATALEGSSGKAADASPQPTAAGIRLAGATSDVHVFDVRSGKWEKMNPQGEPPSPRAAHAAAAVGNMVVIQGGIGPSGLTSEDLHVLDFSDPDRPRWHRVPVSGPGPSARYAHTLSLVANRFLVAMGGNDGKASLGDAWALDTSEKPYSWRNISDAGEMPSPRMYATAASRSDGLLLLCGGRDASGTPLGDAYGFARHRDGRWEWHAAPGIMPAGRYQHDAVFVGNRLHVSGGAVGGGRMVEEANATVVLDTNAGQWVSATSSSSEDSLRRCRHAVASVGPFVFMYGGLKGSQLLDDLLVSDDSNGAELVIFDPRAPAWIQWMDAAHGNAATQMLAKAAVEEAEAALSVRQGTAAGDDMRSAMDRVGSIEHGKTFAHSMSFNRRTTTSAPRDEGEVELNQALVGRSEVRAPLRTPDVRLWHRAVVVHAESSLRGIVRQLSIDQLDNEGRRVAVYDKDMNQGAVDTTSMSPLFRRSNAGPTPHGRVLHELLCPHTWKPPEERGFFLGAQDISDICDAAEKLFMEEETLLELKAPIKIFGDLHGQFGDLMRLFEEYGTPSAAGDILYIDYLFLGDYVDRGSHSLETILLLLALKIEHPKNIHLIRGNHEAHDINALFGFRLECIERLGEDQGAFVWRRINEVFQYLPLAATIEGKILCMHGGIGRSINTISQISSIQRPVTMEDGGTVLMDLLWSDPTTNDAVTGVQPSPRGPGLVTFGPDRVKEFCKNNNLQMIVRAHECVMDGFERFAQGHLITLFSATNYCGTAGNAGAILVLGRDLVMVPKLIHPLPPSQNTSADVAGGDEDGLHWHGPDTWMQSINDERPPTPPRGRPAVAGPSLEYF